MTRWIAAVVLAVALGVGGWFGWRSWHAAAPSAPAVIEQAVPEGVTSGIETVGVDAPSPLAGATPMAQRVAVLGLLNKRNGESRELTLRPGQAVRLGDVVVRLRACDRTAPWEADQLTGAFAQLIVRGPDRAWRRAFSGWLFKERPGLNVVSHPVYDVWTKSCAMSFPASGPDTETLSAPRSSASNSPARAAAPAEPDDASAAPSNAT